MARVGGARGGGTIAVHVDDAPPVLVELAAIAGEAERFSRVNGGDKAVRFAQFPGGLPLLRSAVAYLSQAAKCARAAGDAAEDQEALDAERLERLSHLSDPLLDAETLGTYLEAAVVLESPKLLRDLANASPVQEVASRRAAQLVEQVVGLTGEHATACADSSVGTATAARTGPLSETVEEAIAEVISKLCARLDPRDFRLGPPLAKGSPRICLEVLRAHRDSLLAEGAGLVDGTWRSAMTAQVSNVGSVRSSITGDGVQRVEWTEHQYALHVFVKHLERHTQAALSIGSARSPPAAPDVSLVGAEMDDDLQSVEGDTFGEIYVGGEEEDIDEGMCDRAPDSVLKPLAELVEFADSARLPPIVAAVCIRALLSADRMSSADRLFQAVFSRSTKVRLMVATREIPVEFLRGVASQPAASQALRWMLARYETVDPSETCGLLEQFLLAELLDEAHSYHVIIKHPLMFRLVLWTRSGGAQRGAQLGARGYDGCKEASKERLREVGLRLFELAFVAHRGFLPPMEGILFEEDCPWDTDALDMALLARVPPVEDALQLARRIVLRHLRRSSNQVDVREFARLWPLGRWTLCRDVTLVREAFQFLAECWRAIAGLPGLGDIAGPPPDSAISAAEAELAAANGDGGGADGAQAPGGASLIRNGLSRRVAEELLFKMFTDLEIWRLPPEDLLTPFVPGQVLACHVAAQCKELEEKHVALAEETRENLEEISRLHAVMSQLASRLEATDSRSQQCMQKQADLNDTLRKLR